jgi:parvulin-like peptidyl-prolyl isomerase
MRGGLLAGAVLGLALSAWGLLEDRVPRHALTEDTAAIVGSRAIRRVDYERMLAGVERDRRGPIDDGTRRRVLERMIDEELLVQQALALGLAHADRRVRGELVSSLVDSVVAEADAEPPSPAEIERHYAENAGFFARPGHLRVETLFFSTRDRAESARARLVGGEGRDAVAAASADRAVVEVPEVLLPRTKLRDYLGPALVEAIDALETGIWSEPLATTDGFRLVRVVEREASSAPPLAEIEALVRQDLVRRRGDDALRRYLEGLREATEVARNASLFAPNASR